MNMDKTLREGYELIYRGLHVAYDIASYMPKTREMALTLTKLEEAYMWCVKDEEKTEREAQHG